jgi:hypothetical protein
MGLKVLISLSLKGRIYIKREEGFKLKIKEL